MKQTINHFGQTHISLHKSGRLCLLLWCIACVNFAVQAKTPEDKLKVKKESSLNPTLKKISHRFHQVLDSEFELEKSKLGPALLFENNRLKLIRGSQVVAEAQAAPTVLYHQVKAYSHMCMVAAIKLLSMRKQKQRSEWASQFIIEVDQTQKLTAKLDLSSELKARQIALSALTYSLLENAQKPNFSKGMVHNYIKEVRPLIIKNFEVAAADHIAQIDRAVEQVFVHLKAGERERLYAFTYGSRGSRSGSLVVQYLAQLLGQSSFIEGKRVIYSEGSKDQESVMSLVSKHNVKLALGQLLFDDALKLQKDILSDAAYQLLSEREAYKLTESPSERVLKERFDNP